MTATDSANNTAAKRLPLHGLHEEHGGKMVAFAGHAMPLFYAGGGILAEHKQTREAASLFDVSHMGQLALPPSYDWDALTPSNPAGLAVGESLYAVLTNNAGGAIDDFIVGNDGERGWFAVVNASRIAPATARLAAAGGAPVAPLPARALLAAQGPAAAEVVAEQFPAAADLRFMRAAWLPWHGQDCRVARCGYTGEDGFEISAPAAIAEELARALLANPRLKLAGLGARDSLRLEAGLCLYGNELNEETTPIEAGLVWTIPPSRRNGGNYAGASAIAAQIKDGAPRRLLGLLPQGKAPARQGAALYNDEARVGAVASGGFSPTLQKPIAIAFVNKNANLDNLSVELRGKKIACERAALPFVAHRYHK